MSLVIVGPPKAVKGPDKRIGLLGVLNALEGFTKASFPAL